MVVWASLAVLVLDKAGIRAVGDCHQLIMGSPLQYLPILHSPPHHARCQASSGGHVSPDRGADALPRRPAEAGGMQAE